MTYDEAVAFFSGRVGDGTRDRTRLRGLLGRLGDPQEKLSVIHVAGTNGKGSTVAFLDSILRAAGFSVGAYLSPHVFDLRERWLLDGLPISEGEFIQAVERLKIAGADGLTEFELKTALALERFAKVGVDWAILEAGIGGRDDATSVVAPPRCAVITNVGRDHESILGHTLKEIAAHKAGIIKPGVGAAFTAATGAARAVICKRANQLDIPCAVVTAGDLPPEIRPGLRGAHQRTNAALALRVARSLGVSEEKIRAGIESARLPGRFQVIEREGRTLLLDVAHNEGGALALAEALRELFPERRITLVLGVSRGHAPEVLLGALAPLVARCIATEPPFRPRPAAEIALAARALGLETQIVLPASEAIQCAWESVLPGDLVLVTGSFYTVGETPVSLRA